VSNRKIPGLRYGGPGEPNPPAECNGYFVYRFTRYQDCHEEGGKAFETLDAALEYMDSCNRDRSAMHRFEVFELGRRVPVEFRKDVVETVERSEILKAFVPPA
jgi:hypothetical protein